MDGPRVVLLGQVGQVGLGFDVVVVVSRRISRIRLLTSGLIDMSTTMYWVPRKMSRPKLALSLRTTS